MKQVKSYYQELNFDGYTWSGYWGDLHHFSKRENGLYCIINCNETDLEDGNILDMVKLGVSR
jgi:hypothetical protein